MCSSSRDRRLKLHLAFISQWKIFYYFVNVIYQIKRLTAHKQIAFPVVGTTTGKLWHIFSEQEKIGDLLFSPNRSVYKTANEQHIIEPVHYNNHQSAWSEDEHSINVFRQGAPYTVGYMSTRFPTFRKPAFRLNVGEERITFKGESNVFSSPSLDSYIDSRDVSPQITASTKFLGPEGEFDCAGEINCASEQWSPYIFCLVFFLEMDMIKTIVRANK